MKRVAMVLAAVLGMALLSLHAASPVVACTVLPTRDIGGPYRSTGDSTKSVTLRAIAIGMYQAMGVPVRRGGSGWVGAGLFDGTTYWGVFRNGTDLGTEPHGTHRGTLRPDGSLEIHGEFADGRGKPFDVVWTPERASAMRPRPTPPPPPPGTEPRIVPKPAPQEGDRLPALNDYVYVEELPEAITKVPPAYPDAAREAKVEGTVLVQALVGKDGRVRDTKIVKSIPELDEAAMNAVRQWVFKPAMAKGTPVAVWVAVPVRFSLH